MFNKKRYITKGIELKLNLEIQTLLWNMIEELEGEKDYLQVFELIKIDKDRLKIIHKQEVPDYHNESIVNYEFDEKYLKIFVIDDVDYSTMLMASEY